MKTISASAARQTFPAQLDAVERGEEVEITRHGRVVAVLVSPEALRARRAPELWQEADDLDRRLRVARTEPLRKPALTTADATDLIAYIDAQRDKR